MKNSAHRRAFLLLLVVLGVAGCGSTAKNSDVGLVHTGLEPIRVVSAPADVQIVETGPPVGQLAKAVSGYSCKNKLWDPAPSKENAVALMKTQAKSLGFSAIHSVEVKTDPTSVAKNCWSGIAATGIAFSANP